MQSLRHISFMPIMRFPNMTDAQKSRGKLLDDHDASIDALHENLKKNTDTAHHAGLHHAIEGVKKSMKALRDDDAFGSPGNETV